MKELIEKLIQFNYKEEFTEELYENYPILQ